MMLPALAEPSLVQTAVLPCRMQEAVDSIFAPFLSSIVHTESMDYRLSLGHHKTEREREYMGVGGVRKEGKRK